MFGHRMSNNVCPTNMADIETRREGVSKNTGRSCVFCLIW